MSTASFLRKARALLHVRNQLVRECLAELLSTFILIVSGAGQGGWGWGWLLWVGQGWWQGGGRGWGVPGLCCLSRGVGGVFSYTEKCNSALAVLPLGPCSHSMVCPVPWLWCNQGVVLGSVCLNASCLTAGKGWGSGAALSV